MTLRVTKQVNTSVVQFMCQKSFGWEFTPGSISVKSKELGVPN